MAARKRRGNLKPIIKNNNDNNYDSNNTNNDNHYPVIQ